MSVMIGCPPIELRVSVDAESVAAAVTECVTASVGETCGPTIAITKYFEGNGQGVADDFCLAVSLAIVATPEDGTSTWRADRRAYSPCVPLPRGQSFGDALDAAVQESLAEGLTLEDVEGSDDAFFVLGVFGSAVDACTCDLGDGAELVACSRLREDANDASLFGISCTQCSGRKVSTGSDFASCAAFAGEDCFFEGCVDVFQR